MTPSTGILFSRNRAMQLDGTLRSFLKHCQDADLIEIYVIYFATEEIHKRQYTQLILDFQGYKNIYFYPQDDFRSDLLRLLTLKSAKGLKGKLFQWTLRLGWRFRVLSWLFWDSASTGYILFLVDDNLFVGDFRLGLVTESLDQNPNALAFSLRLGVNTIYCYSLDKPQALPPFGHYQDNIRVFDWTQAEYDFNYPLEVSSSVYRISDVLPILVRVPFCNPNTLEGQMAYRAANFFGKKDKLLCYTQSVTFCNPVNKVQQHNRNRAAVEHGYSNSYLAQKFADGYRIDVDSYNGFLPSGCHQEVELRFFQIVGER